MSGDCGHRAELQKRRHGVNALNVEVMDPSQRCLLKRPAHWGPPSEQTSALRWVMSGGDPSVFGTCNTVCPKRHPREQCANPGCQASAPQGDVLLDHTMYCGNLECAGWPAARGWS